MIPKGIPVRLILDAIVILLCLLMVLFFARYSFAFQFDGKAAHNGGVYSTPKDIEQDEHMVSIDARIGDLHDRVGHDEGIATGFMLAITLISGGSFVANLITAYAKSKVPHQTVAGDR